MLGLSLHLVAACLLCHVCCLSVMLWCCQATAFPLGRLAECGRTLRMCGLVSLFQPSLIQLIFALITAILTNPSVLTASSAFLLTDCLRTPFLQHFCSVLIAVPLLQCSAVLCPHPAQSRCVCVILSGRSLTYCWAAAENVLSIRLLFLRQALKIFLANSVTLYTTLFARSFLLITIVCKMAGARCPL